MPEQTCAENWVAMQSFRDTHLIVTVKWRNKAEPDLECKSSLLLSDLPNVGGCAWADFSAELGMDARSLPDYGSRLRQPILLMSEPGGLPLCVMQPRENGRIAFFTLPTWNAFSCTSDVSSLVSFGVGADHTMTVMRADTVLTFELSDQ